MKDVFDAYKDSFEEITQMVEQGNYKGSFVASTYLTLVSITLDYTDGILISEVLEGVFSQVGPAAEESEPERVKILNEQLTAQMRLLTDSYRAEDKNALYQALRDLRSIATKFQIQHAKHEPAKTPRQPQLRI
jgi:hypothetical protein